MVGIVVEDHHFDPARQQQTAHDLPEATKPGDDHPWLLLVDLVGFAFLLAPRFFQTRQHHQQNRRCGHRQCDGKRQRFRPLSIQYVGHLRRAKDHECKLTPLPQQYGKPTTLLVGHR